jgi:hypothetical protein
VGTAGGIRKKWCMKKRKYEFEVEDGRDSSLVVSSPFFVYNLNERDKEMGKALLGLIIKCQRNFNEVHAGDIQLLQRHIVTGNNLFNIRDASCALKHWLRSPSKEDAVQGLDAPLLINACITIFKTLSSYNYILPLHSCVRENVLHLAVNLLPHLAHRHGDINELQGTTINMVMTSLRDSSSRVRLSSIKSLSVS